MSHRHHSSVAGQVNRLVHDVNKLPAPEAETLYGIVFQDNGAIFDTTYQMEFKSLHEWAEFTVEQDADSYEDTNQRNRFDDEE